MYFSRLPNALLWDDEDGQTKLTSPKAGCMITGVVTGSSQLLGRLVQLNYLASATRRYLSLGGGGGEERKGPF
jgi:hypothetical protein